MCICLIVWPERWDRGPLDPLRLILAAPRVGGQPPAPMETILHVEMPAADPRPNIEAGGPQGGPATTSGITGFVSGAMARPGVQDCFYQLNGAPAERVVNVSRRPQYT